MPRGMFKKPVRAKKARSRRVSRRPNFFRARRARGSRHRPPTRKRSMVICMG